MRPTNSSRFSVLLPASGSSSLRLPLSRPQQRIGPQLLVVVQVLIAQRQPVNALRQHLREAVRDQKRRAAIHETAGQTPQQVDLAIYFSQQQRPTVTRYLTSREPRLHTTRKMGCKREAFLVTLCHQRPLLFRAFSYVWITQLCHENSGLLPSFSSLIFTCCLLPVRNAG